MAGLDLAVDLADGRLGLSGDLDRGTCEQLLAVCPLLTLAAAPVWAVDLAGLTFCDAEGLRALIAVRRAAADAGAAVVAVGARPFLRRLLTLAEFECHTRPGQPCATEVPRAESGPAPRRR
ncbi:STAS domain-containing protein [Blastococcus sp. TF02-9]|uniref:STAS domain-containing protein n=1 Tax=Blastococcus sp. TF02-09 TaxID=2250576 RepID=UPI0018F7C1CC|nr:STAS domain-containing protein [Blastococcus sp. TF02-9]